MAAKCAVCRMPAIDRTLGVASRDICHDQLGGFACASVVVTAVALAFRQSALALQEACLLVVLRFAKHSLHPRIARRLHRPA